MAFLMVLFMGVHGVFFFMVFIVLFSRVFHVLMVSHVFAHVFFTVFHGFHACSCFFFHGVVHGFVHGLFSRAFQVCVFFLRVL